LIEYQHTPLPDIQRWSELAAGTPLFETAFVFENYPVEMSESVAMGSAIGITNVDLIERPHYPLTLRFHARRSLAVDAIYDAERLETAALERLVRQLETLLAGILANPGKCVAELSLLSGTEREQLLQGWNAAQVVRGRTKCIHELFAEQAARTPHAPALVFADQQLSYEQLNERSNQLAHYLQTLGVGPDVIVGLCVDRSLEMVIGLLGVLKAGGAYLPLDPRNPVQRLALMLQDAKVPVLLTHSALLAQLPESGATRVCLDRVYELPIAQSPCAPVSAASSENLAYVIYTSGSTGRPKGTLISHASVTRLFAAAEGLFAFDSSDVWTLFHSLAFDFSVWEIWGALLYGGRVVVVPYWISRSPDSFHELLWREGVTILSQTPSAFRQLIRTDMTRGQSLTLRRVIFGGEALSCTDLQPWVSRHGAEAPQLINMYGLTETTVHVTHHRITQADIEEQGFGSIGHPLPHLRTYVLDASLEPVPIGMIGELYIGGEGLARGYLNRAGLTAQRFIANPFATGERLYRSGDLARCRADGTLEFIGRQDAQVKIRGHRIELGEIEAALREHASVSQAVVVAQQEQSGEKRLIGYVVTTTGPMEPASLRRHLQLSLPEFMVPATLMEIAHVPLTANGKIDYQGLPAPEGRPQITGYVAPRTAVEETLAGIWREVLRLDRVGAEDNFFELGGDSLLAMQVVAQAQEIFKVRLGVRELFELPKMEEFSKWIEQTRWADETHKSVLLEGWDSQVTEEGTV
jgi:amino acid adenylation domain-containing protein